MRFLSYSAQTGQSLLALMLVFMVMKRYFTEPHKSLKVSTTYTLL